MTESVILTKEEAIAALEANAWAHMVATCGHTGCEDHRGPGSYSIHTLLGGLGADWDLDGAIALVNRADKVGWAGPGMLTMGHDLIARVDGKTYAFEAKRPPAVSA